MGDKKAWLVFVIISNILSRTRNSPDEMPVLLLALLPGPAKLTNQSTCLDQAKWQINVDALQAFIDLVSALWQQVVPEGTVIDHEAGKTLICFPIMLARIAHHPEHATLHRIDSRSCSKCEVLCKELGENPQKIYEVSHYTHYKEKVLVHETGGSAAIAHEFLQVGVKIGDNVFTGLHQVNPADLHKPDLLHNIYLSLFNNIIHGVEGFLKRLK